MVKVVGAPGYDDFEAEIIPGMAMIPRADGVMVTVLGDPETKEIFVIPSEYVEVEW